MCLLNRSLAMEVSSHFIIPAFGRHITILKIMQFIAKQLQEIMRKILYVIRQRGIK
jgi:hypothetical protein